MKLTIDTNRKKLIKRINEETYEYELFSKEAFEIISKYWLKLGWNQKYPYTFTWMGRPIIQLPEDMIRIQEVIFQLKPDVIIETGIAHGGSLIYYASLCQLIGRGRVFGIDIEIRPQNREAIERHELSSNITLIEGDSVNPQVVNKVKKEVENNDKVLVVLDSCHSKEHVLAELEAYHDLVTPGSYIVATDGIMKELFDVPLGSHDWKTDNPIEAVEEFLQKHSEFILEKPAWLFNESELDKNITYWPKAWLRRK